MESEEEMIARQAETETPLRLDYFESAKRFGGMTDADFEDADDSADDDDDLLSGGTFEDDDDDDSIPF